jgi:hypothetical protein
VLINLVSNSSFREMTWLRRSAELCISAGRICPREDSKSKSSSARPISKKNVRGGDDTLKLPT